MNKNTLIYLMLMIALFLSHSGAMAKSFEKGIYINQTTAESSTYLSSLIKKSKQAGINAFVIDLERINPAYVNNIKKVKDSGIKYVARIVIFPGGGSAAQIKDKAYWEKRYQLVEKAINLGAQEIQLDYIRYTHKNAPSKQNAKDVHEVIKWFKTKVAAKNVPLQIDVFGIASFGESKHIGQNLVLFASTVDGMNPMVYPSHFEPYKVHAKQPYKTVHTALMSIRKQFNNEPLNFKLIPFIELSNYRYPLSKSQKIQYIKDQIRASEDANADGWYFWSAGNLYQNLFDILGSKEVERLHQ
jgi:hypothetical protein